MYCKICSTKAEKRFESSILAKHKGEYFQCPNCQFLQIANPSWLEEAYKEAINLCDTGILARNNRLNELATIIIYYFFDRSGAFVDYAGGYGIFTRLMRDIGFDYYWCDKYSQNILAQGFEYNSHQKIELLTAFEVLEHLEDPYHDLDQMAAISRNLLFSTELLPSPLPSPDQWWYYGIEHGQHISFYTEDTLKYIANHYELTYYNICGLHLFTEKPIEQQAHRLISECSNMLNLMKRIRKRIKLRSKSDEYQINHMLSNNSIRKDLFYKIKNNMSSKTMDDMRYILSLSNNTPPQAAGYL